MNTYDEQSCNALEKPFYKPIEAALRWCNLIQHETVILQTVGDELFPLLGAFPQRPCLRANAEKVFDAIINDKLPCGRDDKTVSAGDHVRKDRLTIRHTDLKMWMAKHYPDQKPKFLFDEVERSTHAAISAESFPALQVDRDALKAAQGLCITPLTVYRPCLRSSALADTCEALALTTVFLVVTVLRREPPRVSLPLAPHSDEPGQKVEK